MKLPIRDRSAGTAPKGRGHRTSRRLLAAAAVIGITVLTGVTAVPARAATSSAGGAESLRTCVGAVPTATPTPSAAGTGGTGVVLPRDEAAHHDPNEWWYFSGHLFGLDAAGHRHCYGFEFVIFQFLDLAPSPVYIGNLSVADLTRKSFHYATTDDSYPVPTTRDGFSIHSGGWTMRGASGVDVLHAALPGYTLDLQLRATEQPVLHGHDGVIPFGPLGTSKYYSYTSLRAAGTIVDHGAPVTVTGISWMDHQWGAFNLTSGAGWDWFSMQLSNGEQYMLYFIRNKDGKVVQTAATRVESTGRSTGLKAATFAERTTGSWHSPATGVSYGSGWHLALPGGYVSVTPDLRNQELDLRSTQGNAYWEGAVSLQGKIDGKAVTGVGYTEINPPDQL